MEFEYPAAFVHSCVHGRLRSRQFIEFTDNSRFLPRIQMQGYGSVLGLLSVAGLSFNQFGKILEMLIMIYMFALNTNFNQFKIHGAFCFDNYQTF